MSEIVHSSHFQCIHNGEFQPYNYSKNSHDFANIIPRTDWKKIITSLPEIGARILWENITKGKPWISDHTWQIIHTRIIGHRILVLNPSNITSTIKWNTNLSIYLPYAVHDLTKKINYEIKSKVTGSSVHKHVYKQELYRLIEYIANKNFLRAQPVKNIASDLVTFCEPEVWTEYYNDNLNSQMHYSHNSNVVQLWIKTEPLSLN